MDPNDPYESKIRQFEKEIENLKREQSRAKAGLAIKVNIPIKELSKDVFAILADYKLTGGKLRELEKEKIDLNGELDWVKSRNQALKEEVTQLKADLARFSRKYDQLKREYQVKLQEIESLQQNIEFLEQDPENVQRLETFYKEEIQEGDDDVICISSDEEAHQGEEFPGEDLHDGDEFADDNLQNGDEFQDGHIQHGDQFAEDNVQEYEQEYDEEPEMEMEYAPEFDQELEPEYQQEFEAENQQKLEPENQQELEPESQQEFEAENQVEFEPEYQQELEQEEPSQECNDQAYEREADGQNDNDQEEDIDEDKTSVATSIESNSPGEEPMPASQSIPSEGELQIDEQYDQDTEDEHDDNAPEESNQTGSEEKQTKQPRGKTVYYTSKEDDDIINFMFNVYRPLKDELLFTCEYWRQLSTKLKENNITDRNPNGLYSRFARTLLPELYKRRELNTETHHTIAKHAFLKYFKTNYEPMLKQYEEERAQHSQQANKRTVPHEGQVPESQNNGQDEETSSVGSKKKATSDKEEEPCSSTSKKPKIDKNEEPSSTGSTKKEKSDKEEETPSECRTQFTGAANERIVRLVFQSKRWYPPHVPGSDVWDTIRVRLREEKLCDKTADMVKQHFIRSIIPKLANYPMLETEEHRKRVIALYFHYDDLIHGTFSEFILHYDQMRGIDAKVTRKASDNYRERKKRQRSEEKSRPMTSNSSSRDSSRDSYERRAYSSTRKRYNNYDRPYQQDTHFTRRSTPDYRPYK